MRKFNINKVSEAGSLMVEAIAMLGLISMVTPVVYKKSAERMNELQDINAASQMRTLSSALDAYLSDHYATLTSTKPENAGVYSEQGEIDENDLIPYLPEGMVADGNLYGVLGDDYKLSYVRKAVVDDEGKTISDTLTGYVAANNEEGIDAKRASRIATMIGGNGGVVDGNSIYGAQGVWQINNYKGTENEEGEVSGAIFKENLSDNSIVAASSSTVGSGGQIDTDEFLHRREQSRSELNTMYTDLYMYDGKVANDIMGVGRLLIGTQVDQQGRGNNEAAGSLGTVPTDNKYSLYVASVDQGENRSYGGSAYIEDALHAVEDQFSVEKSAMTYNPYTAAVGTEGEEGYQPDTKEQNGTFKVDTTGLYYTDPKEAEFKLTDNTMTYGNDFIKASTTKAAQGTEGQEGYSAGRNDNSFQVLSKEINIVDDGGLDNKGSRVETKTDMFIANHEDKYDVNTKKLTDGYHVINGGYETEYVENFDVEGNSLGYERVNKKDANGNDIKIEKEFNRTNTEFDNILTGKTLATEIETGYLKSNDFDVAHLRAGRADLDDDDKEFLMNVTENEAKIGNERAIFLLDEIKNNSFGESSIGLSVKRQENDGGDASANTITLKSGRKGGYVPFDGAQPSRRSGGGIAMTANDGNIDMTVNDGGDYNVEVKDSGNIRAISREGNITIASDLRNNHDDDISEYFSDPDDDETAYRLKEDVSGIYINNDNNNDMDIHSINHLYLRAGSFDRNEASLHKEADAEKNVYSHADGVLHVESSNLLVDDMVSGGSDDKKEHREAWVHIRHGAIDIATEYSDNTKRKANEGTGYVLADRFVVENGNETKDGIDYTRDPSTVFTGDRSNAPTEKYDHYMVDPAYTSVMHDIKLTSRGGARLSDILPDFINKGIYVVDNSYDEGVDPDCFNIYGNKTTGTQCNNTGDEGTDYASAYLGGIPAPQCPPGYAKVITLQPSGWTMGQVGTLVVDISDKAGNTGRAYIQPVDNASAFSGLSGDAVTASYHTGYSHSTDDEGNDIDTLSTKDGTIKSGSVQNYSSEARTISGTDAVTGVSGGNGSPVTATTGKFISQSDLVEFAGKIDRLVQSSTYMKSAIKVKENENEKVSYKPSSRITDGDNFVGWDTYIGFIYPSSYWSNTALKMLGFNAGTVEDDNQTFSSGVYWNLFPVDKYSIEGYATVYCYFDRTGLVAGGFDDSLVDTGYNQFDVKKWRKVEPGSHKYCTGNECDDKGRDERYVKRLFNPKLKYNDEW